MLTKEQNELLCRVEGEATMGQMARRHWLPACMAEEVAGADGAPVRARLLGEDLVIFKDTNGKLGVLGEYCLHRRASLVFGRNEECGLRCLYHGWKFDVEGNVVDMPSEAPGAAARLGKKTKAYPAREGGGFIWIWMGPLEEMREFEPPAWAPKPDIRYAIVKMHAACNWAQVLEGSIDSAHSSSLHSTNMPAAEVEGSTATDTTWLRPSTDKAPRLQFEPTSYGFHYAAIRKPIRNPDTHQYVRTTLYIAPFTCLIPPNDQYNLAQMLIPVDDVNTMFYWIAWHPDPKKGISQQAWRALLQGRGGRGPGFELQEGSEPGKPLFAKPGGNEGGGLDWDSRHSHAGYGDVGVDGADYRPQPGPSRLERPGGGAVPAHGDRGGEEIPGRRPGHRYAEGRGLCEPRFVRGHRAEDHRLAHSRWWFSFYSRAY